MAVLESASCIAQGHSFDLGKEPDQIVVVDDFELESDILFHDRRGAGRSQFEIVALLLLRLDRALCRLSSDLLAIDHKARAVEIRELGKTDFVPLFGEYELAEFGVRRPRA